MNREIQLLSHDNLQAKTKEGSIFFIGNATMLIRYGELSVLTDPSFIHMHQKVDLGYGLKTKRLTNPAIDIKQLPKIDVVLLSHFHGDHFDQVAEKELDKSIPIVTTSHAAKELNKRGFMNVEKLEKWEHISFVKGQVRLTITSTPGRHGPLPISLLLPKVMGSILDFTGLHDKLLRIYVTGDTLVYNQIKEISSRFKDVNIAVLHLGGTKILGILLTMNSKQGLEMFNIINPLVAIPIHYNDYDVFKSPLEDFRQEITKAGLDARVHYLDHGDTYSLI